jgi:hypothetical protein
MPSAVDLGNAVDCYELDDERSICLTHRVVGGRDQIVDIELICDMNMPRSQRRTMRLRRFDLQSR